METTMYEYYGIGKKPGPLKQQSKQNKTWEENRPKKTETFYSRRTHQRFLDLYDMAEAKRLDAILNSRIKRGEEPKKPGRVIVPCGCGASGCIIVSDYNWDRLRV